MIDKALIGGRKYYGLIAVLLGVIGVGVLCYLWQFFYGLGINIDSVNIV